MVTLCKEIVLFLILTKVLESFQAGNKYGKFIKFIISLVVLLKIITPIVSFFRSDFDLVDSINQIESYLIIEEENLETQVPTFQEAIENVDIKEVDIKVEEVKWEK